MGEDNFKKNNDFESLINVLTEKNQIERFMYRKEIAARSGTGGTKSFVNIKDLKGQVDMGTQTIKNKSQYIGFKSVHYAVIESAMKVELTVARGTECRDDFSFNIKTSDGSAKQKIDYTAVDEEVVMKPGEIEKTFVIAIVDNEEPEPDKEFFVELVDCKNK
jgi:solute carrier family 8 (sodium/calcium exchanger)